MSVQLLNRRDRLVSGSCSFAVHAIVICALIFQWSVSLPKEDPQPKNLTVFDVGSMPDAGVLEAKSVEGKSKSKDSVTRVSKASIQKKSDITDSGKTGANPGDEGTIWTPPAPDPMPSEIDASEPATATVSDVRPIQLVSLSDNAADAVLISYDERRFNDPEILAEVSRHLEAGSVAMTVLVHADGNVASCVLMVSSGSKLLDERACDLVRTYKYKPAQNKEGQAVAAYVTEMIEWSKETPGLAPDAIQNAIVTASPPLSEVPAGT